MGTQAVLLAAGHGRRLHPLTESRPKGMLLVGGKPLLQYAVEALVAGGVTDLVLVVGRHGGMVQAFFKDGADFGARIRYAHQPEAAGTLDALRSALAQVEDAGQDGLYVVSASVFLTADVLRPLLSAKGAAVLVAPAGDEHEQGVPDVRGDRLTGMRRDQPTPGSTRVSTGLFRLDAPALAALGQEDAGQSGAPRDGAAAEVDLALGAYAAAGGRVQVVATDAPWHTVISPWDLLRINERVLDALPRPESKPRGPRITGAVRIGKNTAVSPTATLVGPVTIGDGCQVGDYTVVGPYVSIRNNTVVGSHCEVRRSLLNNNVLLDSRGLLRGCILDDGAQVGPGFVAHEESTPAGPVGCIVGRDAVVGAGVRAGGGAVLAPEGRVEAGGLLR